MWIVSVRARNSFGVVARWLGVLVGEVREGGGSVDIIRQGLDRLGVF